MTRKDLQTKYNIIGENKDIQLFRKRGEKTYGIGYIGNIELRKGKAVFNGVAYDNLDELDKAIVAWGESLPYPADTYCPMYNERWRIESRLIWYLEHKLGFSRSKSAWNHNLYERNIGENTKLHFYIGDADDTDKVTIRSKWGEYVYCYEADDAEKGIATISSIVNASVLLMANDMVSIISVCDNKVNTEIDAFTEDKSNIFGLKKVNFKELMIAKLEEQLKALKEMA